MLLLFQYNWVISCLALILGAVGTLSFSPYDFWPAAIVSVFGLLAITLNRDTKNTMILGFLWGMGFFGTGIQWVYLSIEKFGGMPTTINILLVIILVSYLSIYPMLFSGLLNYFWPHSNVWRLVVAAPAVWHLTEYFRSYIFTGFPWLQFGYSQIDGPLKGLAPILGVETVTYLLITISGLLLLSASNRKVIPAITAISLLLFSLPLRKIQWYQNQDYKSVNVRMVQGNIDQSIKWDPKFLMTTLQSYLEKSFSCLNQNTIIIWPESSISDTERNQNNFLVILDRLFRSHHSSLITGIIHDRESAFGTKYYNTVIVLGDQEDYLYENKNRYNKHHLVPFGEFLPCKHLLRYLAPLFNLPMSSLSRGDYIQPQLSVQGYKITAAICYEIVFGEQVRANFLSNTDLLLTVSNDAWFGHSIGPWQHFQMARMRALELGRPLLNSTNNGITAAVDASGNIISKIPQFERQILDVTMVPTTCLTPYSRFGYVPLWLLTFMMSIIALFVGRKNINFFFK
ncbi:apolipoprotein N-acyltransferase [Candidatus Profftia tarda]|uniref:Apolipoprotein N-acyltransferase n=1 Tax=Candidatus Profftia tarda TaxID=1177216 RepID=A0A8E4EXW2_9ENTR|nr:apolipoprotein N-acyltransferase [Candidatus Profftia tarda]CAD6507540.1 Apolipoprotein N-acyltransferase [Candidatus Profftia tarda]